MSKKDHELIVKQAMAMKPKEEMDENSYLPLRDRLRKAEAENKILEEAVEYSKMLTNHIDMTCMCDSSCGYICYNCELYRTLANALLQIQELRGGKDE